MTSPHFDADVAIIGYGPSGVSAANFLGSRGVSAVAFEREASIYPRARAVTINDWTMRIFQSVGLSEALKSVMDETEALRWITYDGVELNRIEFPQGQFGHYPSYSIYQPAMEEKLREGAERYEQVAVHFGTEIKSVRQDGAGVTLDVADLAGGATRQWRCRYALACDGGSSATREALGVRLLGDTVNTQWVVIDGKVKRWWPNRHLLTFWSDKQRPVVDIALSMGAHRWELPLAPHESERDFSTHEQLWPLLEAMGVSRDDVDIHQHAFYRHHIRTAERWRDGRILLLGDAGHLMPPWAGSGMQSGVRDAYNACWKLAEVLAGRLPESILDTYEAERAPDVARYTQIAIDLGRLIKQELSEAELAALQLPEGTPPPTPPLLKPATIERGWIAGKTGETGAVGKLIPQPRVVTTRGKVALLDDVIGNGFVLLGDSCDPRERLSSTQLAGWSALGASYHAIRQPDHGSELPTDIVDLYGTLAAWMRDHDAQVIAVRPDRFVAASDPCLDVPAT